MLNLLEIFLIHQTIDNISQPEAFFSSDLIEKALRKLAGQPLITAKQSLRPLKKIKITEVNEIDVTETCLYS
jgi:hypothetical protein